jgi:hypothetical protein
MGFAFIERALMKPNGGVMPTLFVGGAKVQADAVVGGRNVLSTEIAGVAAMGGHGIAPDKGL